MPRNARATEFLPPLVFCVLLASALCQPAIAMAGSGPAAPDAVADLLSAVVRIRCGGELSTGVVVSAEGDVLTVAHGLTSPLRRVVVESDGGAFPAIVRHLDRKADVAILRVAGLVGQRVRPMGVASRRLYDQTKLRNVVYAAGRPARSESGPAILRHGRLLAKTADTIRTSCRLTAGDSGGPLFRSDGRLIGLNARIGAGRVTNLHLSLDVIRQALATAHITTTDGVIAGRVAEMTCPPAARQTLQRFNFRLRATGQNETLFCCRVSDRLFVAKRSVVSGETLECKGPNGWLKLRLVASSLPLDLLLLQVEDSASLPAFSNGPSVQVAAWQAVCCHGDACGITARPKFHEPRHRPALGCTLDVDDGVLVVSGVVPGSAAAQAGILKGDVIDSLAGEDCTSFDDVARLLDQYAAGDRIRLVCLRDGLPRSAVVVLSQPADRLLDRSEFLDGRSGVLSGRRTGFENVFQHDAALLPIHMATAVVSPSGDLLGLNIAVRSRESVIALPWSAVAAFAASHDTLKP
ncbi:MAG: trypsin-like peptidase domain-containing protein [Planctomycetaceae bacterium]|nr:trypsin-like peptidase domain-containing protein [Planctomycetaceae bacterium]